jgi:multiple sugar transport system substrate-binding protein
MFRKSRLLLLVFAVLLLITGIKPVKAAKTVVTWFIGLGTGTAEQQIKIQMDVTRAFNQSQDEIDLRLDIAASHQPAPSKLGTLIASGNAPDIIGPMGFSGANIFEGQWLDLTPLIEKHHYDLQQYPAPLVEMYREGDALVGLPFAMFPGVLFYNIKLFDVAGLPYPPAKYGDKYTLGGKQVDWDWDTVATLAKRLTVDANGNDANSSEFDPAKIIQFGFVNQWSTLRRDFATFGKADFWDQATGKVVFPDSWYEQAKWTYNGLWVEHFMPSTAYENSDLLKPHAFASGNVAIANVPIWYSCCLGDMKAIWELGVVPAYKGQYHVPIDADTFRIHKDTKNPDAAFKVLTYLLGEGAKDLLLTYGAYAARPDLQDNTSAGWKEKYPFIKNWDVVASGVEYAVVPSHESYVPNFNEGQLRLSDFYTLLHGDTGKDIDVEKELDKLQADLQKIIDVTPEPMPTEAVTEVSNE